MVTSAPAFSFVTMNSRFLCFTLTNEHLATSFLVLGIFSVTQSGLPQKIIIRPDVAARCWFGVPVTNVATTSPEIAAQRGGSRRLRELFPEAFTAGNLDVEKLSFGAGCLLVEPVECAVGVLDLPMQSLSLTGGGLPGHRTSRGLTLR